MKEHCERAHRDEICPVVSPRVKYHYHCICFVQRQVYRFHALSRSSGLLFFVSAFSLICKHFRHNFEQLAIGFDVYLFPAVHSGLGFPHHFGSIKALGMLLCHIFGSSVWLEEQEAQLPAA